MRTRKTILLLVLMLLAAACSPLRKTQRHSITDSTSLDRSEIRKAVTDLLHEWGTLSQTVVSSILRRLRRRPNFQKLSWQSRTASSRIRLDSGKRRLQLLRPCGVSSVRRLRPMLNALPSWTVRYETTSMSDDKANRKRKWLRSHLRPLWRSSGSLWGSSLFSCCSLS